MGNTIDTESKSQPFTSVAILCDAGHRPKDSLLARVPLPLLYGHYNVASIETACASACPLHQQALLEASLRYLLSANRLQP